MMHATKISTLLDIINIENEKLKKITRGKERNPSQPFLFFEVI